MPGRRGCTPPARTLVDDDGVDAVLVALVGPDPRGVRARLDRGRQAGVLREAAGDHAEACLRDPGRRGRRRRRLVQVGFMRRYDAGVPGVARRRRRRCHRRAADRSLRAPQRVGARATPRTWRSTTPPCTRSTPSGGCSARRSSPPGCSTPRRSSRAAGELQDPLVLLLEIGERRAGRRRGVGEHRLRLRHPLRGRRRGRDGSAGRRGRGPGGARRTARHRGRATGGTGSTRRTTSSCRTGWTPWPPAAAPVRVPGTGTPPPLSRRPACGRSAMATGLRWCCASDRGSTTRARPCAPSPGRRFAGSRARRGTPPGTGRRPRR